MAALGSSFWLVHPFGGRETVLTPFGCSRWAQEIVMLWTIFVVLGILWLLGFSLHVGGSLIHLLLVVAVVILIINLFSGRRSAVWWNGCAPGERPVFCILR